MKLRNVLALALALVCAPAVAQVNQGTGPLSVAKGGTGAVSPTDPRFGAKCDGVTDDTAALQAWASSIVTNGNYIIPNSSCLFKSPLTFTNGIQNVTIQGAGAQSQLLYAGATTTGTIVSMGSATPAVCSGGTRGWTLQNFRLVSNTTMTAGDALYIGHMCDFSMLHVDVGGYLNTNGVINWWNAVHIVGGNNFHIVNFDFSGNGTALLINGDGTYTSQGAFLYSGILSHSGIGLQLAGGVYGFNIDAADILLSGVNVQIDQSQVAVPNGQLFFGPLTDIDATSGGIGVGLNLIDPGVSPGSSIINFQGTWLASAATVGGGHGYCVWIQSTAINWALNFYNNPIMNCQGEGIHSDSASALITVNQPHIDYNIGIGFNQTVTNAAATLTAPTCGTHNQSNCWSNHVVQALNSGLNGATGGIVNLYGNTSGSAYFQANSTGALQMGNNVGGLNTFFTDGPNGTAFAIGNAAAGTIAASFTMIPAQTGVAPNITAAGTDTNISIKVTPKGTGKFTVQGSAPTLTAGCNGSGQAISGNDTHGTITGQTTASTSCTLTFSAAYAATPDCVVTGLSSPLTGAVTVGTGTIVVNFASTANYKWSYVCLGN